MKSLFDLCQPRDSVFDETKRDDTLDLTNLVEGRIDVHRFTEETFVTQGMEQLIETAFKRFRRRGSTGIVKLTQAMGGGKTHSMIMLGLLANHPDLRKRVLGGKYNCEDLGKIKVIAFTGRESDTPYGIWGSIADQLGKKEQLKDYYSPLSAPGQETWIKLLKGEPLLILLDELPPYLDYARAKTIGNSDLSAITATALSNLFTAINKEDLSNVCLVISDLKATYERGSELLQSSFKELEGEVNRSAINIEPVRSASDEVYSVLKTRLFKDLPHDEEIIKVANGYKDAVHEAKQIGYTNTTPEKIFVGVKESYPFHPSIKDLYARFRENQGFQQTRGLIRLMRHIISQFYSSDKPKAKEKYLIGVHDFDLNDSEMYSMIKEIKPSLVNAMTHDVSSNGMAIAEEIDNECNTNLTQNMAKLILVSSLADVHNALLGLTIPEIIGYLCEPELNISQAKERLEDYKMKAWYLYVGRDGRLHFRNVKNIIAEINSLVDSFEKENAKEEIRSFLGDRFNPSVKDSYQRVSVFPAIDDLKLSSEQVTLIITEPYHQGEGLHPDLKMFYEEAVYKNRILFLTGQRNTMDNLLKAAKEYRAITTIIERLEEENVHKNDSQYKQAESIKDKASLNLLASARETFVTLLYPSKSYRLYTADFLMEFVGNKFDGEDQIRKVLLERRKLEKDTTSDNYRKKCEERLFTRKEMKWSEVKERASTNTTWQWHLPKALDDLRDTMLRRGVWRENGGYIEKPPFPKEKTTVLIQEVKRDDNTGEVILKITPQYGDTVHYEKNGPATIDSERVEDFNDFRTEELKLSFLCVDSSGKHETGDSVEWRNKITLKRGDIYTDNEGHSRIELRSAPKVEIRYSTDGSNPKQEGLLYEGDVIIPQGTHLLLAVGVSKEHNLYSDTLHVNVPIIGNGPEVKVDKDKPLNLHRRYATNDKKETYETIECLKEFKASIFGIALTMHKKSGWLELTTDEETRIEPVLLEEEIEHLRSSFVSEDNIKITLKYRKTYFPTGQHFLDWLEAKKIDLREFKESEVIQ